MVGAMLACRTAPTTGALWSAFTDALLAAPAGPHGPGEHPRAAWLTHRALRDRLYHDAATRKHPGWLAPPIAFFSELPARFGLRTRPLGLLERHGLLDRLTTEHFRNEAPPGLTAAADQFLAELLPEAVPPEQLSAALAKLPADEFARRRNEMLATLYAAYLTGLDSLGRYDPRQVHALIARRIAEGGLPAALDGARELHIYGLTSTQHRGALLCVLAEQNDVQVTVYLLDDEATTREWLEASADPPAGTGATATEPEAPKGTNDRPAQRLKIQPAPDELREMEFAALEIKRLILEHGIAPDRIAVVARTGRSDLRLAYESLSGAGIPATARLRYVLDEVPALTAIMLLLRGAAMGWNYRTLRHVLESSYFDLPVNLRELDRIAAERRVTGLDQWLEMLEAQRGPHPEGADATLTKLAEHAARLADPRPLREWIAITRELLDLGWFGFRERVCRAPRERWEVVCLDQQGILTLESLLAEWGAAQDDDAPIPADQWYRRLRRFLATNELALTTPLRTGVQVLEAHEAALVPFDHTFLLHANDGEFPKPMRQGGLFSEQERQALAEAGLPIATRERALLRERALWAAVTAGPATTISFRSADAAGVPLLPSLLVPSAGHEDEIPRVRFVWESPFTEAHADRDAMQRFARSRSGGGTYAATRPALLRRALLSAVAESARLGSPDGARDPGMPGPWNGLLRDPEVLAHLEGRFTSDYAWSASQLESYAQNPFMFLLQRVLRMEEREEADEDTTVLTVGSLGHALLERFHAEHEGRLPAGLDDALSAALDRIAAETFAEMQGDGQWLGLPAMWGVRKRQTLGWVREYLAWELEKLTGWIPAHFEFEFGEAEGRAAVVVEDVDVTGAAGRLRLRGKIDRVDAGRAGHRVVDYKSNTLPQPKGYEDGATLQGALYMAALAACGIQPAESEYRSIRGRKTAAKIKWGDAKTTGALRYAHSIPARVRGGVFEPSAANSCEWKGWWPGGLALVRVEWVLRRGECRFD